MERVYAQILKEDMKVNLIGGRNEGLPINHPAVIVVDITDRADKDAIKVAMTYDPITDAFAYIEDKIGIAEVTPEATQLDRMEANLDYLVMMQQEVIMDWYNKIKRYYELKLWDSKMVQDAVLKGKITQEQCIEIMKDEVSQNGE